MQEKKRREPNPPHLSALVIASLLKHGAAVCTDLDKNSVLGKLLPDLVLRVSPMRFRAQPGRAGQVLPKRLHEFRFALPVGFFFLPPHICKAT